MLDKIFGRAKIVIVASPSESTDALPYPEGFGNNVASIRKDQSAGRKNDSKMVFETSAGVVIRPIRSKSILVDQCH